MSKKYSCPDCGSAESIMCEVTVSGPLCSDPDGRAYVALDGVRVGYPSDVAETTCHGCGWSGPLCAFDESQRGEG